MSKQTLIAQLIERLKSEKPEFFKKVQTWVIIIALIAISAIMAIDLFEIVDLGDKSDKITNALWTIVTFLGGAYVTSLTPTTKPELQDEKTKEGIIKNTDVNEFHDIKLKKD